MPSIPGHLLVCSVAQMIRVLNSSREVRGLSPLTAEARSVAQLVEQQLPHGEGPKRWEVKQAVGSNPTTSPI
jgi:hypothetical protein